MKEKKKQPIQGPSKKYIKLVEIAGKKYKLIYPGMRLVNRWRHESTEIVDGKARFDTEKYLDFAFECVDPIGHNFLPTLDNIENPKEGEEWTAVLLRFLRGDALEEFQPAEEEEESQETG